MRKPPENVKLTSYEQLFGLEENDSEKVIEVELSLLYSFKGHPFKVLEDEKMQETVESIKKYGVLVPGIVRPRKEGGYEIIAGHRRKRGCELAGKTTMPVIVKNYDDDQATIVMVDSNIQRENLLVSEKAFAYQMKFEAMKHQGTQTENVAITTDKIGEETGESGRQVQRYIRLTKLHPELLEMVDSKKLKFIPAVDLSYLSMEEQEILVNIIHKGEEYPSGIQAAQLKKYSISGELNSGMVELIMSDIKSDVKKITIPAKKIDKYFAHEYSKKDIEDIIISLLEEWSKNQAENDEKGGL